MLLGVLTSMGLSLSIIAIVLTMLTIVTYLSYLNKKKQAPQPAVQTVEAVEGNSTEKYWKTELGETRVCTDVLIGPFHPDLLSYTGLNAELLSSLKGSDTSIEIWKIEKAIVRVHTRTHNDKTSSMLSDHQKVGRYINSIEIAVAIQDNTCNTTIHSALQNAIRKHPVEQIPAARTIRSWVYQNGMFMSIQEQFKLLPEKMRMAIFQTVNILGKPKVSPNEFMEAVVEDLLSKKSVIITGKPGTGKTTFATWLLKTLLMHEDMPNISFLAPSALSEINKGNFSINLSGIVLIDTVEITAELSRFITEHTQTIARDVTFVVVCNGYGQGVTTAQKDALGRIGRSNAYEFLPLASTDIPSVVAALKGLGWEEKTPIPVGKPLTIAEIFDYLKTPIPGGKPLTVAEIYGHLGNHEGDDEQKGTDLILS